MPCELKLNIDQNLLLKSLHNERPSVILHDMGNEVLPENPVDLAVLILQSDNFPEPEFHPGKFSISEKILYGNEIQIYLQNLRDDFEQRHEQWEKNYDCLYNLQLQAVTYLSHTGNIQVLAYLKGLYTSTVSFTDED